MSRARTGGSTGRARTNSSGFEIREIPLGEAAPPRMSEHMEQKMRANWVNMAIALGACMVVVLLALAFVPRPENEFDRVVDYAATAEAVQDGADFTLAVPTLPEGWVSNEASYDLYGTPELTTWYVSFVGPEQQWVSLRQVAGTSEGGTNANWVKNQLGDDALQVRTEDVAGTQFLVYESRSGDQAYVGDVDGSTVVLFGTAQWDSFTAIAQEVVAG